MESLYKSFNPYKIYSKAIELITPVRSEIPLLNENENICLKIVDVTQLNSIKNQKNYKLKLSEEENECEIIVVSNCNNELNYSSTYSNYCQGFCSK